MERRKLSETEVAQELRRLPGWTVQDGKLHKQYTFRDFPRAFAFMTSAAIHAQAMDHHPEWCNVYNRVTVDLVTHDLDGISTFDVALAVVMESLAG